jgi:hypothetical protein
MLKDNNIEYLGDGLYVKHDGFQIILMANDPYNPTDTVYLEPSVFTNLVGYMERNTKKNLGGK